MLIYHVLLSLLYYPRYGDIYLYILFYIHLQMYVLIGVFTCHKKKSVWFFFFFLYYSFSVFLLILTILFTSTNEVSYV